MTPADRDVVRKVRAGDIDAFGHLVDRYQHRLYGLALMVVREYDTAEEVTQDAFVRAFEHLRQYEDARPLYPWLAAIAVRVAQNRIRRRGRDQRDHGNPLDPVSEPSIAPSALIADERARKVWLAVASLPTGERTAALLYYRDGLRVREIATALGVSAGTVKTLLFRARRHLRGRLATEQHINEER